MRLARHDCVALVPLGNVEGRELFFQDNGKCCYIYYIVPEEGYSIYRCNVFDVRTKGDHLHKQGLDLAISKWLVAPP